MLIKVTEQHILKGKKWSAEFCPIALALKEALSLTVAVYRNISCGLFDFPTPPEVFQRIQKYDLDHIMYPFVFEIPFDIIDGHVVQYVKDGTHWCANFDDFINLQESLAGFGTTKEHAFNHLKEQYDNQRHSTTHR